MMRRTKLELECKELEERVKTGEEIRKANQLEIQKLNAEITKAEDELHKVVQPKYDVMTRMTNERDEAKKKMDGLYAKQGRSRKFSSKEDRDEYLRTNIKELQSVKADKENALAEQRDALSNLRRSVAAETKNLEQKKESVTKKTGMLQSLNKSIGEKKRQRIELHDVRKEQWRKSEALHEKLKDAPENAHRATSDVRKVMPRALQWVLTLSIVLCARRESLLASSILVCSWTIWSSRMSNLLLKWRLRTVLSCHCRQRRDSCKTLETSGLGQAGTRHVFATQPPSS